MIHIVENLCGFQHNTLHFVKKPDVTKARSWTGLHLPWNLFLLFFWSMDAVTMSTVLAGLPKDELCVCFFHVPPVQQNKSGHKSRRINVAGLLNDSNLKNAFSRDENSICLPTVYRFLRQTNNLSIVLYDQPAACVRLHLFYSEKRGSGRLVREISSPLMLSHVHQVDKYGWYWLLRKADIYLQWSKPTVKKK